jgi:hypothetical protein
MAIEFYTGMAEVPSFTPPAISTISLWYVNLGWNAVFNRLVGNADAYEIKVDSVAYTIYNELCKGTNTAGTFVVPGGIWTHIVCTANSTTGAGACYVNGALDYSSTLHSTAPGAGIFGIGGRYGSALSFAVGILEDVRMYNRVLSAGEIKTLYACHGTDGIISGLLHRWILFTKGGAGADGVGGDNIMDTLKATANIMGGDGFYWGGKNAYRKRAGS